MQMLVHLALHHLLGAELQDLRLMMVDERDCVEQAHVKDS
jgi:hypothetical protein